MRKLIIKVGGDMVRDLKAAWKDPSKRHPGTTTIYVKDADEVRRLLSPERIHLLKESLDYEPTVCGLAEKTGRKQSAISRDLKSLEKSGLIKKRKEGRKVFVESKIDSIEIRFK